MFLILYAFLLLFFWVRAVFWLIPARYPSISPTALANFRQRLLMLYGRYAGFFILIYFLAIVNGLIAGYFERHHNHYLMIIFISVFTAIEIIFDLAVSIYAGINMVKNIQFFKLMKSVKN